MKRRSLRLFRRDNNLLKNRESFKDQNILPQLYKDLKKQILLSEEPQPREKNILKVGRYQKQILNSHTYSNKEMNVSKITSNNFYLLFTPTIQNRKANNNFTTTPIILNNPTPPIANRTQCAIINPLKLSISLLLLSPQPPKMLSLSMSSMMEILFLIASKQFPSK